MSRAISGTSPCPTRSTGNQRQPRCTAPSPDRVRHNHEAGPLDFTAIINAALARLPEFLARWLPGGRIEGREYFIRNPMRPDPSAGSFKVTLITGRWADFAIGDAGGDPVSLAAHVAGCRQSEAARRPAAMRGMDHG